jgi:glycosyltransferase involved in cell wall biosynthesis
VLGLGGGSAFGFPGALPRMRRAPWRALAASAFVLRATRELRRLPEPEAVVAHFAVPCGFPIATRARYGAGTRLEIVLHGSDARLLARLPGRESVLNELLRSGASLRFVSNELRNLVMLATPLRMRQQVMERSRVEPCAIDVEGVPARAEARRALGLPGDRTLAVVIARLIPQKQVEIALAACARMPKLDCIVVGDGPERAALMRRFPAVRFVGHVERPRALAYLSAANVLVSASRQEGAPTAVREARALGTDVVSFAAGDLELWAQRDPGLHIVA